MSQTTNGTFRYYTGFPLNSTLVTSYTTDTIRSIINQAATGKPYATSVWIRIGPTGIQIHAQDREIARTRIPVFLPIALVHDIFMVPSINNIICIVYDELQSNMKGILLYVVYPAEASLLREDFRIYKQANNNQQITHTNRYSHIDDIYLNDNSKVYTLIPPSTHPAANGSYRDRNRTKRRSPKRNIYVKENETQLDQDILSRLPPLDYTPIRNGYHSGGDYSHRRHKSSRRNPAIHSPNKHYDTQSNDRKSHKSRSPKKLKSRSFHRFDNFQLTPEQLYQQQLFMFQQQQLQMAALQAAQQKPLVPIGIYNRYVPKTIPLPTGETYKTVLPSDASGAAIPSSGMAFIEPQYPGNTGGASRSPIQPSANPSPNLQNSIAPTPTIHHRHRHHQTQANANISSNPNSDVYENPSQSVPKYTSSTNDNDDNSKDYLKILVDDMQAMKFEMKKIREISDNISKDDSNTVQANLQELRSRVDRLRARMPVTPNIFAN